MPSKQVAGAVRRRYWREGDARILVDAWKRTGEPLTQFAQRHGVDPKRLARWATRLKKAESGALRFHPVRLTRTAEVAAGPIEIEFRDGCRVRVERGFETEDLRRVLAVLGERATC